MLAIILGALVSGCLIGAIEVANSQVFPLPEGTDVNDPESLKAAMATMPAVELVVVLVAWFIGTLAGAAVAARVAGRAPVTRTPSQSFWIRF